MTTSDLQLGEAYLAESREQLRICRDKIRHCVEQLSDDQLWWRAGGELNSVANLLLHLTGNIGERILSLVGGQSHPRDRSAEFAERGPIAKEVLLGRLDATIGQADAVLAALSLARLLESRRYHMLAGEVEKSLMAILMHTLVHLGGHTQEIVALTRLQLKDRYRFQVPQGSPR